MNLTKRLRERLRSAYWRLQYKVTRLSLLVDYGKLLVLKRISHGAGTVRIAGFVVSYGDIAQLAQVFREIFINRDYYCDLSGRPTIIDAGANIGISTLFFKRQYPDASIVAFEPNPATFAYLKKNVEVNGLSGVELRNSALGSEEGPIPFYVTSDMATGDIGASAVRQHVEYFHAGKGEVIELDVMCEKLSSHVRGIVDLLKLDVEGNESKVMAELGTALRQVKNLIMEYHYNFTHHQNPLAEIIALMDRCQHLYRIEGDFGKGPLLREETYLIRSVLSERH